METLKHEKQERRFNYIKHLENKIRIYTYSNINEKNKDERILFHQKQIYNKYKEQNYKKIKLCSNVYDIDEMKENLRKLEIIRKHDNDIINMKEMKIMDKCIQDNFNPTNLFTINKVQCRKKNLENYYYINKENLNSKKLTDILNMYKQLRNNTSIINMNNSSFILNTIEKINENYTTDNIYIYINDMFSIALDIYLNKSNILLQPLFELQEYLSLPSEKSIDYLNHLKYSIFKKVLMFKTPIYLYTNIPKIIKSLLNCQIIDDYKSKSFNIDLNDSITSKLNYGHFMKGYLIEDTDYNEKEKRKKDYQLHKFKEAISNDKIKECIKWLENNNVKSSNDIHNELLEIAFNNEINMQ